MYDSYIFDVDGTLIDSEQLLLTALQDLIFEEHGKLLNKADLSFAMAMTSIETLETLNVSHPQMATKRWLELIKEKAQMMEPFTGIDETIKLLSSHNKKLGIVTSKTVEELDCDFKLSPLYPLFDVVITASDTSKPKPHPDPLLACIDQLGSAPHKVIYIGDTHYDAECARDAHVDFGLAAWGTRDKSIHGKYTFNQPAEIIIKTL